MAIYGEPGIRRIQHEPKAGEINSRATLRPNDRPFDYLSFRPARGRATVNHIGKRSMFRTI